MNDAQVHYHPVLTDIRQYLDNFKVDRLLVIGDYLPEVSPTINLIRLCEQPEVNLPIGIYLFNDDSGSALMFVSSGSGSQAPSTGMWSDLSDSDPLISAYGWFVELFNKSLNVLKPRFQIGDQIQIYPSMDEGTVRKREFDNGNWWYSIRTDGRTQDFQESSLTFPIHDDDPYEWIKRTPSSAKDLSATLTRTKLRQQLTDTVYSFRASRTIFRPYQFRPVLRLLESGMMNLLVADEVGLGKTIEAGLIWTELEARQQANQVLIVCPSMLVPKWRAEMQERFNFDLQELDKTSLDDFLLRLEEDRLPQRMHAIVSVERLRTWSGLSRAAELQPRFDLIIADEAHVFRNASTKSFALGSILSDWAEALVFLSATPLNLGNEDLYNLLQLLSPGEFENLSILEHRLEPNAVLNRLSAGLFDKSQTSKKRLALLKTLDSMTFGKLTRTRPECIELEDLISKDELTPAERANAKRLISSLHALSAVVTRTRKVEVQDKKSVRSAQHILVEWTSKEANLYQAIEKWQTARARSLNIPSGFATQMTMRLASSCLPAARDRIYKSKDGIRFIEANLVGEDGTISDHILEDYDGPTAEVFKAADELGDIDTKFDAFVKALMPIIHENKRVLVFTFSRYTLRYLEQRLSGRLSYAVMHGDVPKDERHEILKDFRDHKYDVLLASRVASEGLDFEFCSAVVNYDLPWNPMEVEQRIGRIDRFGQTEEKILILNFHTPGTIETEIVDRIHNRIGVFEDSIGELEPIIQSAISELEKTLFDFKLTKEEREKKTALAMTAIEAQNIAKKELETASSYLISSDQVEIDELENTLVESGRFIGRDELVLLLRGWTANHPGSSSEISKDQIWLTIYGNASMADDVEKVAAAGERSRSELENFIRKLRDEHAITICLDQETARMHGADLISANHPLVRAAIKSSDSQISRFALAKIQTGRFPIGSYLVAIARAQWDGLRPIKELWTSAVNLDTGSAAEGVGELLLSNLALGQLHESTKGSKISDINAKKCISQLRNRKTHEDLRRQRENEALLDIRRLSISETYQKKVKQIEVKINTAQSNGNLDAVRLLQSQINRQSSLHKNALDDLETHSKGVIEMEYIAICVVEVI